jgi:hypothetical protein
MESMKRRRTLVAVAAGAAVFAAVMTVPLGEANSFQWIHCTGRCTFNVTPDKGLGDTNSVVVEGEGFEPSVRMGIVYCGGWHDLPGWSATCVQVGFFMTSSSGHLGPITWTLTRTFDGTRSRGYGSTRFGTVAATHTCRATDDCFLLTSSARKEAWHYLAFVD